MAGFTRNTSRFDPYKNFKFRIKWDGRYVAGVSEVSGLNESTVVAEHRKGGDSSTSRKLHGPTKFESVTLKRGVTHDLEFERWANAVAANASKLQVENSLKGVRRDLTIEVLNEAGQVAFSYELHGCWVSELQALPDLDANANAVAIESIKIENEGWKRKDAKVQRRR